ncbi:hypothetical protein B0H14DRAFT_1499002 [Mycena olivaceomarginata]|nr:hypothetical protein B0H14DRAFT_1499002 [Mycena olivaceomarginata]
MTLRGAQKICTPDTDTIEDKRSACSIQPAHSTGGRELAASATFPSRTQWHTHSLIPRPPHQYPPAPRRPPCSPRPGRAKGGGMPRAVDTKMRRMGDYTSGEARMGGTWTRRKMSGARWPAGARVDAMMRHEHQFPASLDAAETSMTADAKDEARRSARSTGLGTKADQCRQLRSSSSLSRFRGSLSFRIDELLLHIDGESSFCKSYDVRITLVFVIWWMVMHMYIIRRRGASG